MNVRLGLRDYGFRSFTLTTTHALKCETFLSSPSTSSSFFVFSHSLSLSLPPAILSLSSFYWFCWFFFLILLSGLLLDNLGIYNTMVVVTIEIIHCIVTDQSKLLLPNIRSCSISRETQYNSFRNFHIVYYAD